MTQILGRESAKKHGKMFKELKRLEEEQKFKERKKERNKMYIIHGTKKYPVGGGKALAPDMGPLGESYLEKDIHGKGRWKPIVEAKHGGLIKGFPKLTKKGWK